MKYEKKVSQRNFKYPAFCVKKKKEKKKDPMVLESESDLVYLTND